MHMIILNIINITTSEIKESVEPMMTNNIYSRCSSSSSSSSSGSGSGSSSSFSLYIIRHAVFINIYWNITVIYAHLGIHTHTHTHAHIYTHTHTLMHTYIHINTHIHV